MISEVSFMGTFPCLIFFPVYFKNIWGDRFGSTWLMKCDSFDGWTQNATEAKSINTLGRIVLCHGVLKVNHHFAVINSYNM